MLRSLVTVLTAALGASASAAPDEIMCVYPSFDGSEELVSQQLVRYGNVYRDPDLGILEYEVIGENGIAMQFVSAKGGAIIALLIEKADGSLLKITAATFGDVYYQRGICHW